METIANRLREFRSQINLSAEAFGKKMGRSRATIVRAEENIDNQRTDFYKDLILAYPELNLSWLLTGTGNMYNVDIPAGGVTDPEVAYARKIKTLIQENSLLSKENKFQADQIAMYKSLINDMRELLP